MKIKLLVFFCVLHTILLVQPTLLKAENRKGVLLHGENYLFYIKAPNGWVVDTSTDVDRGLEVVIYSEKSMVDDSPTVMFVQVYSKSNSKTGKIEEAIKFYKDDTLYRIPYAEFSDLSSVKLKDKNIARVMKVVYRRVDAVGFIDESEVVVILVMSSKDDKAFENAYPAFVEWIRSYNFIATDQNVYN